MNSRKSVARRSLRISPMADHQGDRYRAGKRLWSAEEDAELHRLYPDASTAIVARRLRRTVHAVSARAAKFDLRKSAAYLAGPDAYRLRRGDNVGEPFRFRKGHVPANKGLRRPGFGPGRMKDTQFKRGSCNGFAAAHVMAIGSTRLIDGYVYRKVSAVANVPYTVNWKPEHHLLWTTAHGPLPPGHILRFANGDRFDIRLDNLELVSRRAHMARNSVHNLGPELAKTVQLLGALTRQIRKRDGHGREKQD